MPGTEQQSPVLTAMLAIADILKKNGVKVLTDHFVADLRGEAYPVGTAADGRNIGEAFFWPHGTAQTPDGSPATEDWGQFAVDMSDVTDIPNNVMLLEVRSGL